MCWLAYALQLILHQQTIGYYHNDHHHLSNALFLCEIVSLHSVLPGPGIKQRVHNLCLLPTGTHTWSIVHLNHDSLQWCFPICVDGVDIRPEMQQKQNDVDICLLHGEMERAVPTPAHRLVQVGTLHSGNYFYGP